MGVNTTALSAVRAVDLFYWDLEHQES